MVNHQSNKLSSQNLNWNAHFTNLKKSIFLALRTTDLKKERKRNLLPARVGIYGIIMFLAHTVAWQIAFALKVKVY